MLGIAPSTSVAMASTSEATARTLPATLRTAGFWTTTFGVCVGSGSGFVMGRISFLEGTVLVYRISVVSAEMALVPRCHLPQSWHWYFWYFRVPVSA